ncbi:MAG: lipoprotein-releasing system transmembrane subunit LolC [Candidatus Pelagibacter sp.]|nr:lipoprotein-releasing system transmembrane subunit LolC [Candidatus Pelagibacter sp.]MDP6440200.1 lipoprotein-releasing ABC transporter permease subunit [Pelagibacteraceae bacterium]
MITEIEKLVAFRYLKPKRKEGFLKIISIFSFLGIALGVAVLIIVMSVMNGFRTELIDKILGFNAHIIVKPFEKKIESQNLNKLNLLSNIIDKTMFSFNGEGILINKDDTKGILIRGYLKNDLKKINLLQKGIFEGSLDNFNKNTISIGKDLAISLDLKVDDKITLMSSSGIQTIIGTLPKQEIFTISSIFNSGFAEFDQNVIFMPVEDAISFFEASDDDLFLEIYLIKPERIDEAKKKIQDLFSDYFVYSWADLNQSFFGALKVERNVMFIILSLIIIVAAFNIISGLTILVKNKTKEIAILRTLGVSSKSISKIFFLVGFSIGFFATLTGVFLGVMFSYNIEKIRSLLSDLFNISLFPEEIYFLSKMPSEIDLNSILIITLCSLVITILVSIFPSYAASKLDPIKALKYD